MTGIFSCPSTLSFCISAVDFKAWQHVESCYNRKFKSSLLYVIFHGVMLMKTLTVKLFSYLILSICFTCCYIVNLPVYLYLSCWRIFWRNCWYISILEHEVLANTNFHHLRIVPKDVEQREYCFISIVSAKLYSHYKNQYRSFTKNLGIDLPQDPVVPL